VVHMTALGYIRDRMLSGCVLYVDTGAVAAIITDELALSSAKWLWPLIGFSSREVQGYGWTRKVYRFPD
jgi:hypothetical protein